MQNGKGDKRRPKNIDYITWEKNYEKMLEITEKLIDPSRTNPFPRLNFVINKNHYYNTGTLVQKLNLCFLELFL